MILRNFPWLLIGVVVLLTPFAALCHYAQPFHDDYANGVRVQELGIWGAQAHLFIHWTGRYFTSFLLTATNPLSYSWINGVGWILLFVFGLKLYVVALLLRTITGNRLAWISAGTIAAGIVLMYAAIVPSNYSAFYYFTDVVVYQVPALLLILVPVATVCSYRASTPMIRYGWLALAAVTTIAAAGSNELTIVLLGWLLLVAVCVCAYRRQWQVLRYWLGVSVVFVLAGGIAVAAPGNYARMQVDSDPFPGIIPLVIRTADALEKLFFAPNILLVLSLLLVLSPWTVRLLPARPAAFRLPLFVGAAVVLGGVCLGVMLYKSVWNEPVPIRAINVLIWWLLIGWMVACWAAMPTDMTSSQLLSPTIRVVISMVLVLTVSRVSLRAWRELLTAAPQYDKQWEARYEQFRKACQQPSAHVTVAPLTGISARNILLGGIDYKWDSTHPYNSQAAKWFGLAEISRSDARQ